MADNYMQFSGFLVMKTEQEKDWAKAVLGTSLSDKALGEFGIDTAEVDSEYWPDFEWELQDDGLWIYSEENSDPINVGEFVRAFLCKFSPDASWSMSWANTCSKPRIGEFGGGTMFVTAGGVEIFDTVAWLTEQEAKFEASKLKNTIKEP